MLHNLIGSVLQRFHDSGTSLADLHKILDERRAERDAQREEIKAEVARTRLAEEEVLALEKRRRAEEEKLRAEAARKAEEEKLRAEAARMAEEEKLRAEAAQMAEEEKLRAETARQAEEEKQRVEAARQAEEEKQRAEAAKGVDLSRLFEIQLSSLPSRFSKADVEPVDAAVFCPPRVKSGTAFLVQVYLYQPSAAAEAAMQASEVDPLTGRRGSYSFPLDIPSETRVDVRLEMEDLEIAEPDAALVWRGRITSTQFEVVVPATKLGDTIGRVRFFVSGIPAGTLRFKVEVVSQDSRDADPVICEASAVRYHRAFASYSSEDRGEVLRRVQAFRIAGQSVFMDVLNIDPGESWERVLYHEIDDCDVFLLFWSRAAAASKWVAKEIEYALNRKGGDDQRPPAIQPVPIEGPPPTPPPKALRHLNFNDALLPHIKAASARDFSEGAA